MQTVTCIVDGKEVEREIDRIEVERLTRPDLTAALFIELPRKVPKLGANERAMYCVDGIYIYRLYPDMPANYVPPDHEEFHRFFNNTEGF